MGTMLYGRGVFVNVCYDELNLRQPDLVREIHAAYVKAGAEILETNTFGANPVKLAQHGLADETGEDQRRGGTAGPGGRQWPGRGPRGDRSAGHPDRALRRNQRGGGPGGLRPPGWGLLDGGVDGFIIETFADLEELRAAVQAVRGLSDLPIVAQMTVGEDGRTAYGTDPETFGRALDDMPVEVIGVNCALGPVGVLGVVERLARVTTKPISAQPNAGLPREVGDRKIYMASPEYMASYARRMTEAGARFVGGCCGTTPEHIKAIAGFVQSVSPRHHHQVVAAADRPQGMAAVPFAGRSRLAGKLASGTFTTAVEIVPPKGTDPTGMFAQCRELKAAGVDVVNLPDGPRAQSRMGALLSALLIEREVQIETVCHYCCRDRNLLGMLSDLLGAAAGGLRNLLLITGDPPKMGPYPDATAVFDIDSIGLTNLVDRLNHGLDPGGNSLGSQTQFVIGVGLNPTATDVDRELRRFAWKVDAGAEFAVTQPVFDLDQLDRFLKLAGPFGIPIVGGIWPLVSVRNAEFLANEVPGVSVPPRVLERMRAASARGKEHALAEGVAIAREMLAAVRDRLQGVQVAAPLGRVEVAVEVLK